MTSIKLVVSTFVLLALLGQSEAMPTGPVDVEGCGGGISCCSKGFTIGDNNGDDGEHFIQAYEYLISCELSCKNMYPTQTTGISESLLETYSSWFGRNNKKCWCEFGAPKLDSSNANYHTCVFPKSMDAEEKVAREAFGMVDLNSDGELTIPEYIQAIEAIDPSLALVPNFAIGMEGIMGMADKNGDSKMNVNEYVAWNKTVVSKKVAGDDLEDESREAILNLHDTNRNGELNSTEVVGAVGRGRGFVLSSVDYLGDHGAAARRGCCRQCTREYPGAQMFSYNSQAGVCVCAKRTPGVNPSTTEAKGSFAGLCKGRGRGRAPRGRRPGRRDRGRRAGAASPSSSPTMAPESMDAEEKVDREAFGVADLNSDGEVTIPEMTQWFESLDPDVDFNIELIMVIADKNGDRKLNVNEYLALGKTLVSKEEAGDDLEDESREARFHLYDTNRNGKLNSSEFREAAKFMSDGVEPSYRDLSNWRLMIDQNYDGQISLREWNDYNIDIIRESMDAEEEEIREFFGVADLNSDGEVTIPELTQAYIESLDPAESIDPVFAFHIEFTMGMADKNGDRKMNVNECVAWVKTVVSKEVAEDDLEDAFEEAIFHLHDTNKNGELNRIEFREAVKFMLDGVEPSDLNLLRWRLRIDQNYDLQISLREWNDYIIANDCLFCE